jgi:CheY-like chemotaxis protein
MNQQYKYHHVLLVEDSEIDSYIAKYLMQKYYIAQLVTIKKDGLEALNFLIEQIESGGKLPDRIVLDMRLPELSGSELLDKLGTFPDTVKANLNIVAVSSIIDKAEIDQITENSLVLQFIPKPLSIHSIKII